jgi:hypothetical protein
LRVILAGAPGDDSRGQGITHQAARFPGDTEPHLYLRTDGDKPNEPPQLIREERIPLVSAVPTALLSEQAGTDPQGNSRLRHRAVAVR